MQRLTMQSGAMMAGDDDSDSDYDDPRGSGRVSNSIGPPDMLFGVVPMAPQQRKVFMLVCIVMALATAFNVATVGYSFQDNRKPMNGGSEGNTNSLDQVSQASTANGSMLRATYDNEKNAPYGDSKSEGQDGTTLSSGTGEDMSTHFQYSNEQSSTPDSSGASSQVTGEEQSGYTASNSGEQSAFTSSNSQVGGPVQVDQYGQVLLSQTELMKQMQEQMKQQQEMFMKMQEQQKQQMEQQQQIALQQQQIPPQSSTTYDAPPATTVAEPTVTTPPEVTAETSVPDTVQENPPAEVPAETPTEDAAAVADSGAAAATGETPPVALDSPNVEGYKDAWDLPFNKDTDTPVFWHIPKAGGSTVKDIMGTCHRFTMASEAGVAEGHDQDTEIAVVRIGGNAGEGQDPSPFVNVDTTTPAGLQRAKALGLAQSRLADAIVTPYIFDANELFDDTYKGRLFTVFRHPVDRAISMFNYLQYADWEPTYSPELASMSLEDYARSDRVENNWMTRYLSKQISGDLSDRNVEIAMDIVRRKFLVGLLTKKEETMERLEKYFGWKYFINPTNQEKCREALLGTGANANTNSVKKEKPKPGDPAYDLLAHQNNYDIMLYEYIETLFEEQAQFVQDIPDGYRLEGATCCKCGVPTC